MTKQTTSPPLPRKLMLSMHRNSPEQEQWNGNSGFSIPKPSPGTVLWLLSAVVLVGFIALFLAAEYAFMQVTNNRVQAIAAALLIEAGMVVDAIALLRSARLKDNWPALIGLAGALIVSGTYNYTQAERIGRLNGVDHPWQLATLALGPLLALVFLALAVGQELRKHEERLARWEVNRQAWLDEHRRNLAENEYRLRQAEIEAELQTRREQAERELREKRRLERLERRQLQASNKAIARQPSEIKDELRGNRLEIYNILARNPGDGISQNEIARQLGITRQAVGKHVQTLKDMGLIHRNGKFTDL